MLIVTVAPIGSGRKRPAETRARSTQTHIQKGLAKADDSTRVAADQMARKASDEDPSSQVERIHRRSKETATPEKAREGEGAEEMVLGLKIWWIASGEWRGHSVNQKN